MIVDDSPVVFQTIDLNIGDGYDEFTGKFSVIFWVLMVPFKNLPITINYCQTWDPSQRMAIVVSSIAGVSVHEQNNIVNLCQCSWWIAERVIIASNEMYKISAFQQCKMLLLPFVKNNHPLCFSGVFWPPFDGVYVLTFYGLIAGTDSGNIYIKQNDQNDLFPLNLV